MTENNAAQAAMQDAVRDAIRKAYDDGYNDAKMDPDGTSTYCGQAAARHGTDALLPKLRAEGVQAGAEEAAISGADVKEAALNSAKRRGPFDNLWQFDDLGLHIFASRILGLKAALASAPVADNWQQYALPGETTAEQVCERMNAEVTRRTVAAMRTSAETRETRDELNRLGMMAHTALSQDADDRYNILDYLAERLLALAGGETLADYREVEWGPLVVAPVAGEAPTDDEIIDMAVEPLGIDCDRMPYGVVIFARALLARYAAPQASEAALEACRLVVERFGPTEHDYIFSKRMAIQKCRAALSPTQPTEQGERDE